MTLCAGLCCRKLFWTGSMDSMESLSMDQSSASQMSHSGAVSQQSTPASAAPKSPVLLAAKRLAFELDHLAEVRRDRLGLLRRILSTSSALILT